MNKVRTNYGELKMQSIVMNWHELKAWRDEINAAEYYDPSDRMQFDIEWRAFWIAEALEHMEN
tara:strand:+ start:203 stop:391 length:189 start_codon:yes stop_codon:yes gene_type:complete